MIIHNIKKSFLYKFYLWFIINIGIVLPLKISFAAMDSCTGLCNPLNSSSFAELIEKIAEIVFNIGFPIAVMFIIWAGFLFVTARGSEEKLKTAKKTLTWALIGTAILLGAKIIALAIKTTIDSL